MAQRRMETSIAMACACVALAACRHSSAPSVSASSASAPRVSAVSSASVAPKPSPSPFRFVEEVTGDVQATFYRLPDGVALFEDKKNSWSLSAARHGEAKLSPVEALDGMPEAKKALDPLFGGATGNDLWLSLLDTWRAPLYRMLTFRVNGGAVKRSDAWLRAVGVVPGGAIGLSSTTNPAYLDDAAPQKFERLSGKPALPRIPPRDRLFDVDILPSGAVHALAFRVGVDAGSSIVAWISAPGTKSRELDLPNEVPGDTTSLVHGAPGFIACRDGREFIGERSGRLVVKRAPSFTAAAATPDGDVWFAEGASRLVRARIDFQSSAPVRGTPVTLPKAAELAGEGARACRDLGAVETIAPLSDGEVWLFADCAHGAYAVLRGRVR
jgi:hypothetical protein